MKPVRVIVDVAGRRPEMTIVPTAFDVDGKFADIVLPDFPVDPSVIDRIEIIDGIRWIATEMRLDISGDRRGVWLRLEKVTEET